jgi:hypothetical protein
MDVIHHVTHTPAALRIIEDQKIARGLIYDECSLNDSRTTVVWLSPNRWVNGSRYGNVEFTFDFQGLAKPRKIYWVEVQTKYQPHACRFLVTDQDVDHLPVQPYDPLTDEGPLRQADGVWYWNFTYTGEFLLEAPIWLSDCTRVEFIKHHDVYCALGGCNDRGKDGSRSAGRVIAHILSRSTSAIDEPLVDTDPKRALSAGVDTGLQRIQLALKAMSGKLDGALKSNDSVDAVLRAALLQLASGEVNAAVETTRLIGSDDIFRKRLAAMVKEHFGLESEVLKD